MSYLNNGMSRLSVFKLLPKSLSLIPQSSGHEETFRDALSKWKRSKVTDRRVCGTEHRWRSAVRSETVVAVERVILTLEDGQSPFLEPLM